MKRSLLFILCMILMMSVSVAAAQTRDRDGDGVPDDQDRCPSESGPQTNDGCPLPPTPTPTPVPPPPQQPPPEQTAPEQPPAEQPEQQSPPDDDEQEPQIVLPVLSEDGPCVIATQGTERVNIRAYPAEDAPIVDQLGPTEVNRSPYLKIKMAPVYITSYQTSASDAETEWFQMPEGWVAAWVARQGGDCSQLPMLTVDTGEDAAGHKYANITLKRGVIDDSEMFSFRLYVVPGDDPLIDEIMQPGGGPVAIGLLLPAVQKVREAAAASSGDEHGDQIEILSFSWGALPDEQGGWGFQILPFLEQDNMASEEGGRNGANSFFDIWMGLDTGEVMGAFRNVEGLDSETEVVEHSCGEDAPVAASVLLWDVSGDTETDLPTLLEGDGVSNTLLLAEVLCESEM